MERRHKEAVKDWVFGIHSVIESLNAGKEIEKILFDRKMGKEALERMRPIAEKRGIPIQYVPIEKLNRVTRKNHQGVIAYLSAVRYVSLSNVVASCYEAGRDPFLLILDGVTDVRNFGGIARSAECAGVDAIIVPDTGSAQINSDAMKTSAGALNHIAVCRGKNIVAMVKEIKDSGIKVLAISERGDKSVFETKVEGPRALIMGSEGYGISRDLLQLADVHMTIPMKGKISSLNVSVATGIALFQLGA